MLGPPGAGKGTQGSRLAARWAVPHIATGDILRRAITGTKESALARAARVIREGHLIPDDLANEILFEELAHRPEAQSGWVLDGYPRTVAQAVALDGFLQVRDEAVDAVLALQISEPAIISRLTGRLTCLQCGATFHQWNEPPRIPGVCDVCGGELTVREDDREDRIRLRLALYREWTEPLAAHYHQAGLLRAVAAGGREEEVFRNCLDAMQLPADSRGGEPGESLVL